jgi:DNA-binding CsgD family transcriptional regulator
MNNIQKINNSAIEHRRLEIAKAKFYQEANIQKLIIEDNGKSITLKKRELECLIYLMRGYSAKEIASHLGISPRTVECYVLALKQKLRCTRKSELINKAINIDIIKELSSLK